MTQGLLKGLQNFDLELEYFLDEPEFDDSDSDEEEVEEEADTEAEGEEGDAFGKSLI